MCLGEKNIITQEKMVPIHLPYGPDGFRFYTLICLPCSRNFTFRAVTGIPSYQGILFEKACHLLIFRETKPFEDTTR